MDAELFKKLLEALEKFFSKFFGDNSVLENRISAIAFLLMATITLFQILWKAFKALILHRNQKILNKDLRPFFSKTDVYRATKYYIFPKYKNVAPNEDDEPGSAYIAAAKEKLLPLFLDKVFKKDALDEKFFLILADSGMGKTSFLINLYIKYRTRRGQLFNPHKYDIKLLPLGYFEVADMINALPNKENTIILLDAFDEDIHALDRHEERMNELIGILSKFRFVIITCRTQFFPSDVEEPNRTKYFTFGLNPKEYKFQKIYLSVFDDRDVKTYLKKRFKWPLFSKYLRAKKIAEKIPGLVIRPLLLSYIDDLLISNLDVGSVYDIYKVLVDRWIEREASKPGIMLKYGSINKYKIILYEFSKGLSKNLYENRSLRGGYLIGRTEMIPDLSDMQIRDFDDDFKMTTSEKRQCR